MNAARVAFRSDGAGTLAGTLGELAESVALTGGGSVSRLKAWGLKRIKFVVLAAIVPRHEKSPLALLPAGFWGVDFEIPQSLAW